MVLLMTAWILLAGELARSMEEEEEEEERRRTTKREGIGTSLRQTSNSLHDLSNGAISFDLERPSEYSSPGAVL